MQDPGGAKTKKHAAAATPRAIPIGAAQAPVDAYLPDPMPELVTKEPVYGMIEVAGGTPVRHGGWRHVGEID